MKKALWLIPAVAAAILLYLVKANPLTMTAYTLMAIGAYAATIVKYEKEINEQSDRS